MKKGGLIRKKRCIQFIPQDVVSHTNTHRHTHTATHTPKKTHTNTRKHTHTHAHTSTHPYISNLPHLILTLHTLDAGNPSQSERGHAILYDGVAGNLQNEGLQTGEFDSPV